MSQCCIQMKNPCPFPQPNSPLPPKQCWMEKLVLYCIIADETWSLHLFLQPKGVTERLSELLQVAAKNLLSSMGWTQKEKWNSGLWPKDPFCSPEINIILGGVGQISLVKYLCGKGQNSQPFLSKLICLFLAGPSENWASWFQDFIKNLANNLSNQTWWCMKVIFGFKKSKLLKFSKSTYR